MVPSFRPVSSISFGAVTALLIVARTPLSVEMDENFKENVETTF